MDGVIFDELQLNEDRALDLCKGIIDRIFENGGDVVLNWHGRSFASTYKWKKIYRETATYCKKLGLTTL